MKNSSFGVKQQSLTHLLRIAILVGHDFFLLQILA